MSVEEIDVEQVGEVDVGGQLGGSGCLCYALQCTRDDGFGVLVVVVVVRDDGVELQGGVGGGGGWVRRDQTRPKGESVPAMRTVVCVWRL